MSDDLRMQSREKVQSEARSAFEHVLRVGSTLKYERHRVEASREDLAPRKRRRVRTAREASRDNWSIHAQDTRLYSTKDCFENGPWPVKRKKVDVGPKYLKPDSNWDEELSDGVDPISFTLARLSSQATEEKLLECCPDADFCTDPESHDIEESNAVRALLYRSWERAVHAVNSTVPFQIRPSVKPEKEQGTFLCTETAARIRCKYLGLARLFSSNKERKCPNCTASFSERKLLAEHYYGTKATRGCAWGLIEKEERRVVEEMFLQEAQGQLNSVLTLLTTAVKSEENAGVSEDEKEGEEVMDWRDVLALLESSMESSRDAGEESLDLQTETLQAGRDEFPLLLNKVTLESIKRRLEGRYS